MKIPKAIYLFLLIIIGIQVYGIVRNNRVDDQLLSIQAAHEQLKVDFRNVMTTSDSIILLNDKLAKLEHGKVDSLFATVQSHDKHFQQLQYRQYELKNEYKKVADRLDSLGAFADLPAF